MVYIYSIPRKEREGKRERARENEDKRGREGKRE